MELPQSYRLAAARLVEALPAKDINWALTGSVAHFLQGAHVVCHDVDVQTDADGAYEVAARLDRWAVEPVEYRSSEKMRSHFGRFRFHDLRIDVEVMGALQKRTASGDWTEPADPAEHRLFVAAAGVEVPVLSLSYEAEAYELIGRPDRAELLRHLAPRH